MTKGNHDLQLLELRDTITKLNIVIRTLQETIVAGPKREATLQE